MSDETVANRSIAGLIVVGLGAIGAPLQAAGLYLPGEFPTGILLGLSGVLGLAGGWLLAPRRPLAGIAGGVSASLSGFGLVLGYVSLWGERREIFEVELLVPALLAGLAGVIGFGVVQRSVYARRAGPDGE